MVNSLFSEIRECRDETERIIQKGENWKWDEDPLTKFNDFFEPLLPEGSIEEMLRQKGSEPRATNFLGGLTVLRDLGVQEGTAVRLTDSRDEEEREQDYQKKLNIITGDVLSKDTLNRLPKEQDLILSMGQGALINLPLDKDYYYFITNRLYENLSPKGTLILQAPSATARLIRPWVERINKEIGLQASYFSHDQSGLYSAIRIDRISEEFPKALPTI